MKPSRAIELAIAETINKYGDIGADTKIRAFMSMEFNGTFSKNPDREYPFVGVAATPPITDADQVSQMVDVFIICETLTVDDKNHEVLASTYEAVQGVLDKVYSGFKKTATDEYTYFNTQALAYDTGDLIANDYLSLSWADAQPPTEDAGAYIISMTLRVHFGRSDF